ncbi:Reductase efuL [Exophiala dermatitidis]
MPPYTTAQETRNILIIGSTGTVGTYITRAIIDARDNFDRICVLTSEKTLVEKVQDIAALEAWGVEIFTGGLDSERAVKKAYEGIDTIVSCVGRAGIEKQINLITWAEQAGVRRFFASEYGTDIEYWPESAQEPPHQLKLKVRAHMKTMRRLEHTYLVTGPYSDLYFGTLKTRPELGEFDVKAKKAVLLGDGDGPVSFTAMADVGKFVVAALVNNNASRNATLIVHSFTATPHEILAEYEAQTGSTWEKSYTSLERLRQIEKEEYQVYSPLATVVTLRRIWTEGGTLHKYYDETVLGHIETETLQSQVAAGIQKQLEGENHFPSLLRKLSLV